MLFARRQKLPGAGPRRLDDLEPRERRRAIAAVAARAAATAGILIVAYYLTPGWGYSGWAALVKLLGSFVVFTFIVVWLARRVTLAELPELRAAEVLALIVPLFLYLFATLYLSLSHDRAAAFSEPLNHTRALYFTITVLSTVGFGDITPRTDGARILVAIQMLLDLVLLGALVRLLATAAKKGLQRS